MGSGRGRRRSGKVTVLPAQVAAADARRKAEAELLEIHAAAQAGDAAATHALGRRYADGVGVDADLAEAARLYGIAGDLGCAEAANDYGVCHESGLGVPRDRRAATAAYERAAALGSADALFNMACGAARDAGGGAGDGAADYDAAIRLFRDAADAGHLMALENLAVCYDEGGMGLERNPTEAQRLFADLAARRAAIDAGADDGAGIGAPVAESKHGG